MIEGLGDGCFVFVFNGVIRKVIFEAVIFEAVKAGGSGPSKM